MSDRKKQVWIDYTEDESHRTPEGFVFSESIDEGLDNVSSIFDKAYLRPDPKRTVYKYPTCDHLRAGKFKKVALNRDGMCADCGYQPVWETVYG